jgi:hypothetical protein
MSRQREAETWAMEKVMGMQIWEIFRRMYITVLLPTAHVVYLTSLSHADPPNVEAEHMFLPLMYHSGI